MRLIPRGRSILNRIQSSNRFMLNRNRSFCSTNSNKPTVTNSSSDGSSSAPSLNSYNEQYKALEKLDFMTAAKILFSGTPKKNKFGLDFHLVQFFFACLPSLAVYLVALYARSEMRKMDAELEIKKQAEFEAQAKEMERKAAEEKAAAESNPQILEVKERLDKLEERVKEIVMESKKRLGDPVKTGGDSTEKKEAASVESYNIKSKLPVKISKERGTDSTEGKTSGFKPVTGVPLNDQ